MQNGAVKASQNLRSTHYTSCFIEPRKQKLKMPTFTNLAVNEQSKNTFNTALSETLLRTSEVHASDNRTVAGEKHVSHTQMSGTSDTQCLLLRQPHIVLVIFDSPLLKRCIVTPLSPSYIELSSLRPPFCFASAQSIVSRSGAVFALLL